MARRAIDDTHKIFSLYALLYGFEFDREESTRLMQREIHDIPVGSRVIRTLISARPRIELSSSLTYAMLRRHLPAATRVAYPPHGLYYYLRLSGASGSPGMPARIVYYNEQQARVKIVIANRNGLTDYVTDVNPAIDLMRVDTDAHYTYSCGDYEFMYTQLGGSDSLIDIAIMSDPLGFMYFGL